MIGTDKVYNNQLGKRWVLTIGVFLIVQLIFSAIDGTLLEPNINDSGNLFGRIARWILDLTLFTKWMAPYSFPFFNLVTTVYVIAILIQAIHDIIQRGFENRKKRD